MSAQHTSRLAIPTRADMLIESAKLAAAAKSTSADQSAFEVGWLRAEVRNLCSELDAYKPHHQPHLRYLPMTLDRGQPVSVGFTTGGGDIRIEEVWCNGIEIVDYLSSKVLEGLRQDVGNEIAEAA